MKITLDWRRSAQENAQEYFDLAKEAAKKIEGAKKAIEESKLELEKARKKGEIEREQKEKEKKPKMKRKKQWFEKYKWFFTSGGKLVAAGRDSRQNDNLFAHIMADDDLFFHADIQGAPATILVGGKEASAQEKKEAAQFAASHSSAWKTGAAGVDVYAVSKEQLSKHAQGGYVGAGGFAIAGEREWFRSTQLGLAMAVQEDVATCIPLTHPEASKAKIEIRIGSEEKGAAAKKICRSIPVEIDDVLLALPSGKFRIVEKNSRAHNYV